jgi:hypothetical protein
VYCHGEEDTGYLDDIDVMTADEMPDASKQTAFRTPQLSGSRASGVDGAPASKTERRLGDSVGKLQNFTP